MPGVPQVGRLCGPGACTRLRAGGPGADPAGQNSDKLRHAEMWGEEAASRPLWEELKCGASGARLLGLRPCLPVTS